KFGLAVTGTIHPDRVVTNAGSKPGDVLVLTKPLGSGFLCTAIKKGTLPEDVVLRTMEVMATLNRGAAEAMVEARAHAATDVTGFGVLGPACGMADGANVTLRIRAKSLPKMDGLEGRMIPDHVCGGQKKNLAYGKTHVSWGPGVTDDDKALIADPQTS